VDDGDARSEAGEREARTVREERVRRVAAAAVVVVVVEDDEPAGGEVRPDPLQARRDRVVPALSTWASATGSSGCSASSNSPSWRRMRSPTRTSRETGDR
jgi:hypothetical protein